MKKIAIIIMTLLQLVTIGFVAGVVVLIAMGKLYALVGCMAACTLIGVLMLEEVKEEVRKE